MDNKKPELQIVLPPEHPQSEESLRGWPPAARQRIEKNIAEKYTLRCLYCFGLMPSDAVYCPSCGKHVQSLYN